GLELGAGSGSKSAEMIVHRPRDEPGEGHHQVVLGWAAVAPLEIFKIERTLVIHEIRVSALPAGGLPNSVKMNQNVAPRGGLEDGLGELDGFLVVVVE